MGWKTATWYIMTFFVTALNYVIMKVKESVNDS